MNTPLRQCLVAHVNFARPLTTVNELRHVQHRFSQLSTSKLVWWRNYLSPAGYKHHMGRSMAIFEVGEDQTVIDALKSQLEQIVGVVTPHDLMLLRDGQEEVRYVDRYKKSFSATLEDPFFRADSIAEAKKVRLDWDKCIAMVVRTQELAPNVYPATDDVLSRSV